MGSVDPNYTGTIPGGVIPTQGERQTRALEGIAKHLETVALILASVHDPSGNTLCVTNYEGG